MKKITEERGKQNLTIRLSILLGMVVGVSIGHTLSGLVAFLVPAGFAILIVILTFYDVARTELKQ
jgi:uncharacterized membrane protein YoaK (UPF0700 family)